MEHATLPSEQDVKSQASRIYDALDARGYGIIKRQAVAEALPDNRVSMQSFPRLVAARNYKQRHRAVSSAWSRRHAADSSAKP